MKITTFDRKNLIQLFRELFIYQEYYFQASTDTPFILDCGGNVGMATLYFKWLYPKARIDVFEPDPTTFSVLTKNIAQNRLADVTAHNCALWSTNGDIEFFVDDLKPGSQLMSTNPSRIGGRE